MTSVKTVSSLVAYQVLEQLKIHCVNMHVVEFENDEVFLANDNGLLIRVSRTSSNSGEIVCVQGNEHLKKIVQGEDIQSFNEFFRIPII